MRVLGIDAGGTKTVCYLANEDGRVLSESRGPGANLTAVGPDGVEAILRQVIEAAAGPHSVDRPPIESICLGMAGVDRPDEAAFIRAALGRIVTAAHVVIVNDALVALEAGAPGRPGIVVISGTGSIAYGRDAGGRAARSGGWGYILADEGSGYWLGRQALRAVVREADGRGPATSLTRRLLEHYEVAKAEELVRKVYSGDLQPASIATLASMVQAASNDRDAIADGIIETGAIELTAAALSVARQLDLADVAVVLAGGIFRAVPHMRARMIVHVKQALPGASITALEDEPARGAVGLALRAARGEAVVPRYI